MPNRLPLNTIYFTPHIDCGEGGLTLLRIDTISQRFGLGILHYAIQGTEQSGLVIDFGSLNQTQDSEGNIRPVHCLKNSEHNRIILNALPELTKILQKMIL